MDKEQAKALIGEAGLSIVAENDLPNGHGVRLQTAEGPIVCVYHSGKCVLQGKHQELLKGSFDGQEGIAKRVKAKTSAPIERGVFVVYGHEEGIRTELEAMLRRWDLEPLILDQLPSEGQTIIEKLEKFGDKAKFAVVLATPDDEGHKAKHPDEKAYRARQNVVMELGMMLAKLGRPNVAILTPSSITMERPSDIQGLLYIPYKDSLNEAALTLAKEINARGIPIDLSRV